MLVGSGGVLLSVLQPARQAAKQPSTQPDQRKCTAQNLLYIVKFGEFRFSGYEHTATRREKP